MKIPEDFDSFTQTLEMNAPNLEWPDALKSLWFDAKGDWEASHNIAQDMHNAMGSWLHAYLHRKEGDAFNAGYWYRQAGRSFPKTSLKEEYRAMVEYALGIRNGVS